MKVEVVHEEFPFPRSRTVRPKGLHVGQIIQNVMIDSGFFKFGEREGTPAQSNKPMTVDMRREMQFTKGFLWEEVLTLAFGNRSAVRPPPVRVDEIWCSPDGINHDDRGFYLEEYKCTTISSTKDLREMMPWLLQVKAYCYAFKLNRMKFRILHLCGNRRDDWTPQYTVCMFEFTDQELVITWNMLRNRAIYNGWLAETENGNFVDLTLEDEDATT